MVAGRRRDRWSRRGAGDCSVGPVRHWTAAADPRGRPLLAAAGLGGSRAAMASAGRSLSDWLSMAIP